MGNLTNNFSTHEFACQCGCGTGEISGKLVDVLQEIRDHFGASVVVTSGIRCATHNAAVGGASKSKHIEGIAADIQVKGVEPAVVYAWLDDTYPYTLGLGLYHGWVHIDVRDPKARWGST
jgi:uncharacterized protein YcbK (DUF882 family)